MARASISELEHAEIVGLRMKQAIHALGMKANEVARLMDVSPQRLNGWINGPHRPSPYYLAEFCRVLPVTADWLLLGQVRTLSVDMAERLAQASLEKQAP